MRDRMTGKEMSRVRALNLVKIYGPNIKLIKNPTEEVQLEAVKNSIESIFFIEDLADSVKELAIGLDFNDESVKAKYVKCKKVLKSLDYIKDDIDKKI